MIFLCEGIWTAEPGAASLQNWFIYFSYILNDFCKKMKLVQMNISIWKREGILGVQDVARSLCHHRIFSHV